MKTSKDILNDLIDYYHKRTDSNHKIFMHGFDIMKPGIYQILNTNTGKSYIGQAVQLKGRIWSHIFSLSISLDENKCLDSRRLTNSYKYWKGKGFEYHVICNCEKHELDDKEIFYIKEYHSHISENGYNLTYGGKSVKGLKLTEKSIERHVIAQLRYYQQHPERKKQQSEIMRIATKRYFELHPEKKKEHSEKLKKLYEDPIKRKEISNRVTQLYIDRPEIKTQISKTLKTYFRNNPDKRDNISKFHKNLWKNEEHRKHMKECRRKEARERWKEKHYPYDCILHDYYELFPDAVYNSLKEKISIINMITTGHSSYKISDVKVYEV